MLFYLCEKADMVRESCFLLGICMFMFVIYVQSTGTISRVNRWKIVAAWVALGICFALFMLLPDSDLAYELCRRAGITF